MSGNNMDRVSKSHYGVSLKEQDFSAVKVAGSVGYAVLCFANRDYNRLLPLFKDLTRRSVNLWRGDDPKEDPKVFRNTVAAIDNCNTFVLFLSKNALTSKRVMYYELDYALKTRPRDIYPVIIEDGLVLPQEISSHFAGRLFLHRAGGTDKDLEEALFRHFCEKGCHPDYPIYDQDYEDSYYEEYPYYEDEVEEEPKAAAEAYPAKLEFSPVVKESKPRAEASPAPSAEKRALPTHPEYEFERNQNGATITKYKGKSSRVEIPAKLFGYGVSKLGEHAFEDCDMLEEVAIPTSITEISTDAFKGCRSLTRVVLPPSITKICSGAFRGCINLPTIVLPSSVVELSDRAFDGCSAMNTITIPHRVSKIGEGAFNRCTSLGTVSLPDSLKEIDESAFSNCSKKLTLCATKDSLGAKYAAEHDIKLKRR